MSKRKHVMPSFKELMEDLKPMTFREKVDHLWTYYKEYLFLAVLAVILATGLITAAINANRETLVLGIVANSPMSQEGKEYLEKGYAEKIGAKNDWEVLLRAASLYNIMYVCAANQFGKKCAGRSSVADPDGRIVARASDCECTVYHVLDMDFQKHMREVNPSYSNRRPDLYDI